jgi:hypothetical protein
MLRAKLRAENVRTASQMAAILTQKVLTLKSPFLRCLFVLFRMFVVAIRIWVYNYCIEYSFIDTWSSQMAECNPLGLSDCATLPTLLTYPVNSNA